MGLMGKPGGLHISRVAAKYWRREGLLRDPQGENLATVKQSLRCFAPGGPFTKKRLKLGLAFFYVKSPGLRPGLFYCCGERGIRTLGTPKGSTVFETAPIDHSGISPEYNNFAIQFKHQCENRLQIYNFRQYLIALKADNSM
jgi:hypothetical protein